MTTILKGFEASKLDGTKNILDGIKDTYLPIKTNIKKYFSVILWSGLFLFTISFSVIIRLILGIRFKLSEQSKFPNLYIKKYTIESKSYGIHLLTESMIKYSFKIGDIASHKLNLINISI